MKAFDNSNTYWTLTQTDPNHNNLIGFLLDYNPRTVQIPNYDCFHIQRHNKMYEQRNCRASFATTCSSKSVSCPYNYPECYFQWQWLRNKPQEMDIIDNFLAISIYFTIPTEIFLSRTNLAHLYSWSWRPLCRMLACDGIRSCLIWLCFHHTTFNFTLKFVAFMSQLQCRTKASNFAHDLGQITPV